MIAGFLFRDLAPSKPNTIIDAEKAALVARLKAMIATAPRYRRGCAAPAESTAQLAIPTLLARITRDAPGLAAWRGLIGIVFVASMTR